LSSGSSEVTQRLRKRAGLCVKRGRHGATRPCSVGRWPSQLQGQSHSSKAFVSGPKAGIP
jgi:hypothetical protein